MSNNCLVTKLKGEVQNDDLLRLNEMLFDYLGRNDSLTNMNVYMFMLDPSSTGTLNIKSAVDMHLGDITGPITRETTVAPGVFMTICNTREALGSNPISNLIDVKGNIHDLCKLSVSIGTDITKIKTNIASMFKYGKIYAFGFDINYQHDFSVLPPNDKLECLAITVDNTNERSYKLNLADVGNKFPLLKTIAIVDADVLYSPLLSSLPEGVEYIRHGRFYGATTNWPSSLKGFTNSFINTSMCTGSIESFVEKARDNGRSSGYLIMTGSSALYDYSVITYNGAPLKTYLTNNTPPVVSIGTNNYFVLTWDADTISWSDTAPADAVDITSLISVYRYNKAQ